LLTTRDFDVFQVGLRQETGDGSDISTRWSGYTTVEVSGITAGCYTVFGF